jgi:hypothetical protein
MERIIVAVIAGRWTLVGVLLSGNNRQAVAALKLLGSDFRLDPAKTPSSPTTWACTACWTPVR